MRWKYKENYSISSIYLKIYLSDFIQAQYSDKNLMGFLTELVRTKLQNIPNPIELDKSIFPCNESDTNRN